MPTRSLPPRSNIYTLVMVLTAIVFAIGLVMNGMTLDKYNSMEAVASPTVKLPDVVASSPDDLGIHEDAPDEADIFDN